MDFKNYEINMQESLKDLKQKLVALDVLMHNSAIVGDPVKNSETVLKNYNKSNPFNKKNKITN